MFSKSMRQVPMAVAIGAALVAGVPAPSHASDTSYAIAPNARKLLAAMQSAYAAMNSLTEEVVAGESSDLPHPLVVHTSLKILRPGYLMMTSDSMSSRSGSSAVVADGDYCYVTAPQYPARYLKFAAPASADTLQKAASEGILSSFTIGLFAGSSTVATLFNDLTLATLQVAKPVRIDGALTDTVVSTDRNGVTLTLFIDRTDHLLRRIVAIDPNKPGQFTETYRDVVANAPLSGVDFAFTPPPNRAPFYASSFDQAVQDPPNGR